MRATWGATQYTPARMDARIADRYEVLGRLGEGVLGEVVRVRDLRDGSVKALKLLKPRATPSNAVARFEREFRVIKALAHPNIIRVFDSGVHGDPAEGRPYFSMELLDGSDLAAWRLAHRPAEDAAGFAVYAAQLAYVGHQIADALAAVHGAGIVHRDLKPANVFVRDGRHPRIKLLDFGHARDDDGADLTRTGTVLGTATYMAPEQATGAAPAPSADVYALGCVLFEALAGRPPFEAPTVLDMLLAHVQRAAPPLADEEPRTPPEFAAVVHRLLAKDPAARPSAAEACAELAVL